MQFAHITSDTSQGACSEPALEPCLVVRCGICRSDSLSNSMVNATSTWESRVDKGRPPERAPRLLEGSALAGAGIEGEASLGRPFSKLASTVAVQVKPRVSRLLALCPTISRAFPLTLPAGDRQQWGKESLFPPCHKYPSLSRQRPRLDEMDKRGASGSRLSGMPV